MNAWLGTESGKPVHVTTEHTTSGLSQSNRYQTPQDQSDIGAVNRSIRAVNTIALLQSQ